MSTPQDKKPAAPNRQWDDDDADSWRHPPVAPRDEGVAESLGKAVSNVVTGPGNSAGSVPAPKPVPKK